MLKKLRKLLTRRDKQFLLGLLFFSIVISIIETVGISIIMPFISVATDFNNIHTNIYYEYLYELFNFKKDSIFVASFGIILILFYLLRSMINLSYYYLLNKFTQGRYHLLAYRLFKNYLGMPYSDFISKNSSILTKVIITEAVYLTTLISSVLLMTSEFFVAILIYGVMLYVDYQITLILTIFLFLNAFLMIKTVSVKVKKAGEKREAVQKDFYEIINRSFGNFKLIKLQSKEDSILLDFGKASSSYATANITNMTLNHVPRLFLEAIGFGIIVFIITYLVWKYDNNISSVLAIVSMFVLALYRLMPSLNRILSSYNQILFSYKSLDLVYNDLLNEVEDLGKSNIDFTDKIIIKNLEFEYNKSNVILKDINLTIKKGEKIAFIGESGSGKSTLVDVIIGLHKVKKGTISSDGITINSLNIKSWRAKIGYIPQMVYLFDGTVGENVCFGFDYDKDRLIDSLKKAKIYNFLKDKEGLSTPVGEGGIMLSGGQKQRIAIARALYINPEILVLDEATSALDEATETEIMDEIYEISEDKTLIIIAHRLTTLKRCKKIYRLENGEIVDESIL